MTDRTLRQLVWEARVLKTEEARKAWAEGLSPTEVEVFSAHVQGLIDNLTKIFRTVSEAILEGTS